MRIREGDCFSEDIAEAEAWLVNQQDVIEGRVERITWMHRLIVYCVAMAEKPKKKAKKEAP